MCMAAEWLLIEKDGLLGVGEREGVRRRFSLMLLPQAQVGDLVLVHAGFALAIKKEPPEGGEESIFGAAQFV